MKILHLTAFLTSFVLFTISAYNCAYAIALDLDKINPLTPLELIPEDDFIAATDLVDETPYDDEFLSYQVRLPKGWQQSTTGLNAVNIDVGGGGSNNVLGVVSRYLSPPKNHERSIFNVEAVALAHEIGARNWFIDYVLKSGLSLEQVGFDDGRQVEAVYIEVEGDETYVVRVKAIINGPRMVLARYYLPVELYKDEKVQQAQVIQSFTLTNRQDIPIENYKIHGFLDQSYFDYPESWTLNAPSIKSINRMKVTLYHRSEEEVLKGQINIYLTNKSIGTSRSEELKFYRDKFQVENYKFGRLIEKADFKYDPQMAFGTTEVYEMKSLSPYFLDYELWVSVMENKDYIYFTSLLTPSRDSDFYTWARNTKTYERVVKSVRRQDDSVDAYQFLQ